MPEEGQGSSQGVPSPRRVIESGLARISSYLSVRALPRPLPQRLWFFLAPASYLLPSIALDSLESLASVLSLTCNLLACYSVILALKLRTTT